MNGFDGYWMIKYRSMVWYVQEQSYQGIVELSVTLFNHTILTWSVGTSINKASMYIERTLYHLNVTSNATSN